MSNNNEERLVSAYELETEANTDRLAEVSSFVEACLEEAGCGIKTRMQISVAVEEVFVNIASYAYASKSGKAKIKLEIYKAPSEAVITFCDSGTPYDPMAREDPDVSLSAEDRDIGGLGVYIVKKTMDEVRYEYINGQNVLKIKKAFPRPE